MSPIFFTLQTLREATKPHAQKLSIDACLAQGAELPRLELAQRAATVQPDEARLERMPGDRSRPHVHVHVLLYATRARPDAGCGARF